MRNNEHLALFVLGIGTLAITFLLLFALRDSNTVSIPLVDKEVQTPAAQASLVPQPQAPAPEQMSMEVLDRQIKETFAKTAAYLGRGTYEEKEHIALLERLEFYGGMSSIKPEYKKTAQDLSKDMGRLLTLKESVARQVKVAAQISAVETDVQIFLAKGVKDEAAARKLTDRIESLYAIHGLSDSQNKKLRTSLAALKNAFKSGGTRTASAPASPKKAVARKAPEPPAKAPEPAPVVKASAEPKPEPEPAPKAPAAAEVSEPSAPAVKAGAEPKPEPQPAPEVSAAPPPQEAENPDERITKEKYYKVMTLISSYFVQRRYRADYHAELTADLLEVSKNKDYLNEEQQRRLSETIAKMKRIDEKYGTSVSSK